MTTNLNDFYAVLRHWALNNEPQLYTDLSNAYHARTGDWFEPHGSWDKPLGALNNRLVAVGYHEPLYGLN
jgi:hypothetical protein